MATPRPGRRVRGSSTGRPIMAVLDLLGRRWSLRILWELRDGPRAFRSLSEACGGVSPTVLNTRLRELRDWEVVELSDAGYALTDAGRELGRSLASLQRWADRWSESAGRAERPKRR